MLELLKGLWKKIIGIGMSGAIDALDNLEEPLTKQIDEAKEKIQTLDSRGLAVWMIDVLQDHLRAYFKVKGK